MTRTARCLLAAIVCSTASSPLLATELRKAMIQADGSSDYVTVLVPEGDVSRYTAVGYEPSHKIDSRERAIKFRDDVCALSALPAEVLARLNALYGFPIAEVCASANAAIQEWN